MSIRPKLQLTALIQTVQQVPPWALLSLVMNTLLFITVLVLLRQMSTMTDARSSMIPHANAFASSGGSEAKAAEEAEAITPLGERHYLDYQQWVDLLAQEAAVVAARDAPQQTILLGDSLSLWFPDELLPGRKTWLNQAISGENSAGLLKRLSILDQNDPEAIFIMIGINDLIWGKSDEELLGNTREIVRYLQQSHPDARIVLQSILPHGAEQATWEGRERLLVLPSDRIQSVNADLKAMAEEYGIDYLDLYPLFANGEGNLRADLTADGLHLNWQGYMVWRTAIALFSEMELED